MKTNAFPHSILPALLAMCLASAAPLVRGAELLEEFTFESEPAHLPNWGGGYGGTYKPVTGWKEPFKASLGESNPHSGGYALKMDYQQSSSGKKIVHSPAVKIPEIEGRRFVDVRFFYRTKEMGNANIQFQILQLDEKGAAFRYVDTGNKEERLEDSAEWKEIVLNGALENKTTAIQLVWVVGDEMESAELWLDDISVELKAEGE